MCSMAMKSVRGRISLSAARDSESGEPVMVNFPPLLLDSTRISD